MSECASRMANHLFATVPVGLERTHRGPTCGRNKHFTALTSPGNSSVAANARVASRHAKVAHYVPAASPGTNRTIL